jgi:hypothetical protein
LENIYRHILHQIVFDCARIKGEAPRTGKGRRIPVKARVADNMSTLLRRNKFLAVAIRQKFRRLFTARVSALGDSLYNGRMS